MKKRILGLLLALCLVVGLLPMAALADGPKPEIRFNYVVPGTSTYKIMQPGGATLYWQTGNFTASEPNTFWMKLVDEATALAEGWNVKLEYPADGIPTMTLKDAKIVEERTICFVGEGATTGTKAFDGDVKLVLEGENYISCDNPYTSDLFFNITGTATIAGPGKLKIEHGLNSSKSGIIQSATSLVFDNANIDIVHPSVYYASSHGINAENGDILIKGGNINITGINEKHAENTWSSYRPFTHALRADADANGVGGNVTIQDGAKVRVIGSCANNADSNGRTAAEMVYISGKLTIKNSDVEFASQPGTYLDVFGAMIPQMEISMPGGYQVITSKTMGTYNADTDVLTAPDSVNTFDDIANADLTGANYFKVTHEHSASGDNDCTTDDKCTVCGVVVNAAKASHTPAADDGDCTTAVLCANPGCTQIATPAKAAHTPEADDGDCTTAIKCADCGTVTTPAETAHTGGTATCTKKAECTKCGKEYGELAKHTYTRPDCGVDSICSVCNQVAVPAGQHTGGTATCQAKAKCQDCGQEYGELGVCAGGTATCAKKAVCATCGKEYGELSTEHKPAADDGNCTTAIKCSVCGKETTAANAAHAYTDNNDASCNNAGCTFTRTIETPKPGTNGSAQTGDVSVFVAAGLALASAVSFGGVTVLRKKK